MSKHADLVMEVYRNVDTAYREMIQLYPPLSDLFCSITPQKTEMLRQIALINNQTLALCNCGWNSYHFLNVRNADYKNLFQERLDVSEFLTLMHSDDLAHFQQAWDFALSYIGQCSQDELLYHSLIFECRLKDCHQQYQRVLFKYKVMLEDDSTRGQLLLFLRSVNGAKQHTLHRGVYVVDIRDKTMISADRENNISDCEIEVINHCQKGSTSEEIADKLNRSKDTIRNHRCNVLKKLSLKETGFATLYLLEMGLI